MAPISAPPPRSGYRLDDAPPRATSELNGALPSARIADNGNGRGALDPVAVARSGSDKRESKWSSP